jgi:hypothetical protein
MRTTMLCACGLLAVTIAAAVWAADPIADAQAQQAAMQARVAAQRAWMDTIRAESWARLPADRMPALYEKLTPDLRAKVEAERARVAKLTREQLLAERLLVQQARVNAQLAQIPKAVRDERAADKTVQTKITEATNALARITVR